MPTKNLSDNKFLNLLVKHSTWLYFGWVFFIALLTLVPGSVLPKISWNFISIDKTVHIIMFAMLSFLALVSGKLNSFKLFKKFTVVLAIITTVGYGYVIELIQSFIPERSYDLADLTADCVGTLVGYGLFLGMLKILQPKRH